MAAFLRSYRAGSNILRISTEALHMRPVHMYGRALRCHALPAAGGASGSGSGGSHRRKFVGGDSNGGQGPSYGRAGEWIASLVAPLAIASTFQVVLADSAEAARRPPRKPELTVASATDALWDMAGPMMSNLGFSGIMGLVTGVALKKVGGALAVLFGSVFALIQGLAYAGFITVNWTKVHEEVARRFDANKDGKVDKDDFKLIMNGGLGVLAQGVPSVGGFLTGLLLALKMF